MNLVYRPTVRYDERYREYVEELFKATNLDRNQIMRLALFLLGHSEEGKKVLSNYLKKGSSLPSPSWSKNHTVVWLEKTIEELPEGETSEEDVKSEPIKIIDNRGVGRRVQGECLERSTGEISQQPRTIHKSGGGVKIVIK